MAVACLVGIGLALVLFSAGVLASNFLWNSIAMAKPFSGEPVTYADYWREGNTRLHLIGAPWGVLVRAAAEIAATAGCSIAG